MINDFTEKEFNNFLTLPKEKIIVAKRQHWIALIMPFFFVGTIGTLLLSGLVMVHVFFPFYLLTIIASFFLVITVVYSFLLKVYIDWYYHMYVITTRKILEIACIPFFSDIMNDVILDQVRVTEVDARTNGFFNEILDVGDVVITFDRPSHEGQFVLRNVPQPREVGTALGDEFETLMHALSVWFRKGKSPRHVKFSEDVFIPHN